MIRRLQVIAVIIIMCVLCTPMVLVLSGYREPNSVYEGRKKSDMPPLPWKNEKLEIRNLFLFQKKFKAFFDDHIIFREHILDLFATLKRMAGLSPIPSRVILGDDGWLFLGPEHANLVKKGMGMSPLPKQVIAGMEKNIKDVERKLDSMGIKFYLAVPYDKQAVCRNHLSGLSSDRPPYIQQLIAELRRRGIHPVDLCENFHDRQMKEDLYFRTDTHWNETGLFLGYQTLMQHIKRDFPQLKIHKETDYRKIITGWLKGDMGRMTRFDYRERRIGLVPRYHPKVVKLPQQLQDLHLNNTKQFISEERYSSHANHLKILVFHDSFFGGLPLFMMDSFGEAVFLHGHLDMSVIKREKPDIVVCEVVERHLYKINRFWHPKSKGK